MYKPRYFEIQELVDRVTFERFGVGSLMFFSPLALQALDGLREYFNRSVTVNNWHKGGPFQFRGLRPRGCAVGGEYSQHRFGNAFDCDVAGLSAGEVRKEILLHKDDPKLELITCLEADVSWVHFDCRNVERIRIVKP
jgi:hypothetical protein